MKRLTVWVAAALLMLAAGVVQVLAQDTFKVPFPMQAGELKLPKGDYTVSQKDLGHLLLKHDATGKEFVIPVIDRIKPEHAEPELVIDAVGNFAPSYTDYVTDYLLAQVWLPGKDGFLIHVVKGAHSTQTIRGEHAK